MLKFNLCIVIPVYNEEEILHDIIDKALIFSKKFKSKIIFVNDNSTDSSKKILSKVKNKKIIVINKKNEGHGKAIIAGYKKAIKLKPEFILQIDSDNQIAFDQFKKLFKYKYRYELIVGKRKNRKDPMSRIIISFINKVFIYVLFGEYVNDPNCPLRIIKTSFLKKIINNISFSKIPNILMSIIAKKENVSINIDIKHKERFTGASIRYFKLFKLCMSALLDIFKFRLFI